MVFYILFVCAVRTKGKSISKMLLWISNIMKYSENECITYLLASTKITIEHFVSIGIVLLDYFLRYRH